MPRVRYTADGGRYRVAGVTFEPDDVNEVSEALAEHLVDDVGDFARVTAAPIADEADSSDGESTDDADETSDESGETVGEDDLVESLQDMTIPEIEDDLESGRYDDRLDELAEAEQEGQDRTGVHDAIGVRRAEIEEA